MSLTESVYNECNLAYRTHSNQQEMMLNYLSAIYAGSSNIRTVASYGCGFGIFEKAFLERLDWSYFAGVDSNQAALESLAESLALSGKDFDLVNDDLSAAEVPKVDLGLSVHSLYRLSRKETDGFFKSFLTHTNSVICMDPYTSFWKAFRDNQVSLGRPVQFAGDVLAYLNEEKIAHKMEELACEVLMDRNDVATLKKVLAFVSYSEAPLSYSEHEVLEGFAALGATMNDDTVRLSNPLVVVQIS